MQRKLIVYIAMSLDGFIATKDDDLSFLSMVEKEGEDYGYARFMETIDVVILGRRTYDKVLSMGFVPHPDKEVFVLSRTEKEKEGTATFYKRNLKDLVQSIRQKEGKHIFCDGGAQVVTALRKENLVDEIIVSIIPVLLGDGISLFQEAGFSQNLTLLSSTSFEKGLVQLHYKVG